MATTVTYDGNTIDSVDSGETTTIQCKGMLMKSNIEITNEGGGEDGGGISVGDLLLSLSMNTSNYVMTAMLKDKNGNVITSSTVDLPLESMVVNGKEENGNIVLTLQNGNTVSFSISHLVNGLVSSEMHSQDIEDVHSRIDALPSEAGATFTPKVSDDCVLSWTNDKGLSNPSSVNIKGKDGNDGKDYILTATDKDEIADIVLAAMGGQPVFGCVDRNNNIVITAPLEPGTYTAKYEMEDGSVLVIGEIKIGIYSVTKKLTNCYVGTSSHAGTIEKGETYTAILTSWEEYTLKLSDVKVVMGGVDITSSAVFGTDDYVEIYIEDVTGDVVITATAKNPNDNQLLSATNVDGTPYVGDNGEKGYNTGNSVTKDGVEVVTDGMCCTGFIPVTFADKVYVQGIGMHTSASWNSLVFYDSSKTKIYHCPFATSGYAWITYTNDIFCFNITGISNSCQNAAYFRLSAGTITDETVITVNKPIG